MPDPATTTLTTPRADEPPALAALVDRARRGDGDAFSAIYRRLAPMVHAVLLSHGAGREADDMVQDVFLAAWKSIGSLRSSDHAGGWLATIARNRARRAGREPRPARMSLPLPDELVDPRAIPDRGEGPDILAAVLELPEAYRETLLMRLCEGMTGPEIADATGLTAGSVRVNLCRGMARLREILAERGLCDA